MFEDLTRYIELFAHNEFGSIANHGEHAGTQEDPIPMPYVCYDDAVEEFKRRFYDFSDAHPEYALNNYDEVLESKGVECSEIGFERVEASDADAQTMLAMIMTIIRKERFCDGLLLEYLKNGSITQWLCRLRAIDEAGK